MWILAAVSIIAATLLTGRLLIQSHLESTRQQIQAAATSLVTLGITDFSELKDFDKLNRFVETTLQMDRVDKIIRVFDHDRKLIYTTAGPDYDKLPTTLARKFKKPSFLTLEGEKREYESVVIPYEGRKQRTFYLQVAIPLPNYAAILNNLWLRSLAVLTILIAVSVALAHWLSKLLLKPVEDIASHLRDTDPASVEEWRSLQIDAGGQYLKSIVDGINTLCERTKSSILGLRAMSRYVAHELRTPLTILRGEAENVLVKPNSSREDLESTVKSSLEEIHRMEGIINTVLQIGDVVQAKKLSKPVKCNLDEWFRENTELWQKSLERPLDVEIPGEGDFTVFIDTKLLFHLIDNLVRNVKKHTSQSSTCKIRLESKNGIKIYVTDSGEGLHPYQIDSLNRMGPMSELAGVGLNLCFRITEVCGLKLTFTNLKPSGLQATVEFPKES